MDIYVIFFRVGSVWLNKEEGGRGERANDGERDTCVIFFLVRSLWLNKEEEGGGERAS